jgi:hypothetical protein
VEQRGAQHPAGRRVGVAEGRGVLGEGVVVDDGGLVVVETLAQEPFLRAGSTGDTIGGNGGRAPRALTGLHHQGGPGGAGTGAAHQADWLQGLSASVSN